MDLFGDIMTASMPPNAAPTGHTQRPLGDLPLPNIDVPLTPAAQRLIDRCSWHVQTSFDDSLDLIDHFVCAARETPECTVSKLMNEEGILPVEFINAIEQMLGETWSTSSSYATEPNLRLERVIIRAKREAYRRRHAEVSSMHLLWGLLRERSGPAIYEWERAAADHAD
jgi:ATP-dependent Clp protease ATP-binding subunit ClpA